MTLQLCLNNSIDFIVKCNKYYYSDLICVVYKTDSGEFGESFNSTLNSTCLQNQKTFTSNNDYDETYFYRYNLFLIMLSKYISLVLLAIWFSFFIVSNVCYAPVVNKFNTDLSNNYELYNYDVYLFEYLDEFYQMEETELSTEYLKSLKNKFIKQDTPRGSVLINYDYKNDSFNYCCKTSNEIPFEYLDVVSRIYVVKYNCKKLYTNKYDSLFSNDANLNVDHDASATANATANADGNNNGKKIEIFYSRKSSSSKKNLNNLNNNIKSNKYKYKGTIKAFFNKCKFHNYKINTVFGESETNNSESGELNSATGESNGLFFLEKQNKSNQELNKNAHSNLNYKLFKESLSKKNTENQVEEHVDEEHMDEEHVDEQHADEEHVKEEDSDEYDSFSEISSAN